VLAFAVRPVAPEHTVLAFADVDGPLVLLGLVGLIDPPRAEAAEAVAECRGAGIRVKMITSDHKGTAAAIGRQIGLLNPDSVLTESDLDAMDDRALAAAVVETDIFVRTSPEHKLRLVMALQSHGMFLCPPGLACPHWVVHRGVWGRCWPSRSQLAAAVPASGYRSISNTRLSSRAQLIRTGLACAQASSESAVV